MKEKYLKCLIVIVGIILGGLFIYKGINKDNKPLPEVKLKEIVNKDKSFAIMIQNESGYKEYNSDTWPGNGYKFKEAKCIDNNGNEIKEAITYEEGKITLTTNKTIYCTIYFDYKGTINILRENDSNKNLSSDIQGNMYRYQASFPECDNVSKCENATKMTNWICFGTTGNCGTNEDNVDKYMYRIIGITKEGQLYLLKETFLKERETTGFAWNDKYYVDSSHSAYCDDGKCPEWNTSLLFKRINGTINGKIPGSGRNDGANTNIFVDSSEYDYLKSEDGNGDVEASEWYKLIADHDWMYGDTINTTSSVIYNGKNMYDIETGQTSTTHYVGTAGNIKSEPYTWNTETDKVTAKISLMYLHDVAYAYANCSSGECSSRGKPENETNVANSWIHFRKDGYNTSSNYEWLSTRHGVFNMETPQIYTRYVYYDGRLNGSHELYFPFGVRPVFYLNSNTKIASGDGTKENPFILDI